MEKPKPNKMRCGNCGHETAVLYRDEDKKSIFIECCLCKNMSLIRPTEVQLKVYWVEDNAGLHYE